MGQYHKLVNLDKQEVVHPHDLGFGLKQYEHTGCEASVSDALYLLVTTSPNRGGGDFPLTDISGRWVGDRVVVVGDYTKDEDIENYPNAGNLYSESEHWFDITPDVRKAFTEIFKVDYEQVTSGSFTYWKLGLSAGV